MPKLFEMLRNFIFARATVFITIIIVYVLKNFRYYFTLVCQYLLLNICCMCPMSNTLAVCSCCLLVSYSILLLNNVCLLHFDLCQISVYALGAPRQMNFGSLGSPSENKDVIIVLTRHVSIPTSPL